jgi:drug/metabolite transporter (DMT)-like permease
MEAVNAARSTRIGIALMVLAALQWGLIGIVGRVAMEESVAPLSIAFWRAALGACWFALHARATGAAPLRARDRGRAIALGVGGVAVMYLSYLSAVRTGGVALASILLYSAPLWVAVGGWLGWGERPQSRELIPLGLTLLGVAAVALASGKPGDTLSLNPRAVGWGLLSGVTYALYYLMGRPLFAHNTPSRVLAWALAVGAVALAPFVNFDRLSPRAWVAVGFLSAICTFGAYLAYAYGVQRLPPSRAATVATLEPVVALGVAYAVWGEHLRPLGLLGAALVIAGILWSAQLSPRAAAEEIHP